MSRHNFAACMIVGYIALVPLAAHAQELGAADALYASGVQAYFSGRPADAESSFSRLMTIDRNDPRAYYFRALSRIAQGRDNEARSDMELGAQIEARLPYRFDIGKTLERVQGSSRLLLEQYRTRARASAGLNPPRGPIRAPDAALLRERRIVPLDEFSRTGEPKTVAAPLAPLEPLTRPASVQKLPGSNSTVAPAGAGNPFGDDPAPASNLTQPKTPPAKAAAVDPPPAEAPLPPAPKPNAPAPQPAAPAPTAPAAKPTSDDAENPF